MNKVTFERSKPRMFFSTVYLLLMGFLLAYGAYCMLALRVNENESPVYFFIVAVLFILSLLLFLLIPFAFRSLFSNQVFLSVSPQGFVFKPNIKTEQEFFSWQEISDFSLKRTRTRYTSSYSIEIHFKNFEKISSQSRILKRQSRSLFRKSREFLIIPLFYLEKTNPEKVFEAMKYFEREWRIEQNRAPRPRKKLSRKKRKNASSL